MVAEPVASFALALPDNVKFPPLGHAIVSFTEAATLAIAFAIAALPSDWALARVAPLPTLNAPTADIASIMSARCSSLRFAFGAVESPQATMAHASAATEARRKDDPQVTVQTPIWRSTFGRCNTVSATPLRRDRRHQWVTSGALDA